MACNFFFLIFLSFIWRFCMAMKFRLHGLSGFMVHKKKEFSFVVIFVVLIKKNLKHTLSGKDAWKKRRHDSLNDGANPEFILFVNAYTDFVVDLTNGIDTHFHFIAYAFTRLWTSEASFICLNPIPIRLNHPLNAVRWQKICSRNSEIVLVKLITIYFNVHSK